MSPQIILLLIIVTAGIILFLSEKLRPDLVAIVVMLSLGLTGILTSRETFSGLSNPSVILIMAVFIMTGALFRTGVSGVIGKWLVSVAGHSENRLVTLVVLAAAGLSLFMNNIASAAVIMPAVMDATRRTKISPSRVLLPMAMATQLRGMATLFTTSNIVASGVLVSLGLPGFGLFDFAAVGGLAALAGLAYLIFFSRRLLPARAPTVLEQAEQAHRRVDPALPAGRAAAGGAGAADLAAGVAHPGRVRAAPAPGRQRAGHPAPEERVLAIGRRAIAPERYPAAGSAPGAAQPPWPRWG